MNKSAIVLIIGAGAVALLYVLGRTNRGLAAANPILTPYTSIIPTAGRNTPINTSGSAPYRPPLPPSQQTAGPSVAGAVVASVNFFSSIAAIFKGSPSDAGTVGSGGVLSGPQAPASLLDANTVPTLRPGTGPIPLPSAPALTPLLLEPAPPPPNIVPPSPAIPMDVTTIDYGAAGLPSPVTSASDFGAAMDAAITNPAYVSPVFNSTPDNYGDPSYPLDGGETAYAT